MSQQARTYFDQARTFLRAGNAGRALELLRRAKLLSDHDISLKAAILREMIAIAAQAGCAEEEPIWSEQLAALERAEQLAPSLEPDWSGQLTALDRSGQPITARKPVHPIVAMLRRYLRYWPRVALVIVIVAVLSVAAWLLANRITSGSSSELGETTNASQTVAHAPPVKLATPRLMKATARPQRLRDSVGLVLWIQRYQRVAGGHATTCEKVISSGTAFAVAETGVMLTNKHVTAIDELDIPPPPAEFSRSGRPQLKICFGADRGKHYDATILHESPSFDLAVIQIERTFAEPFTLSVCQVAATERVLAVGYTLMLTDTPNRVDQSRYANTLSPNAFEPVTTTGVITAANQVRDGVLYHLFDAKIERGNSGGPLLLENSDEVVGIVTMNQPNSHGAQGYNFALALSQLRDELNSYLP